MGFAGELAGSLSPTVQPDVLINRYSSNPSLLYGKLSFQQIDMEQSGTNSTLMNYYVNLDEILSAQLPGNAQR